MAWTEVPSKRTRTGSHYNLDGTSQFVFDQVLKTYRHFPTAGPDSDVLDGVVDMTPQRVDVAAFDGWRITSADWHYALGRDIANHGTDDGWVGFGGRQGQHWFKYRLQSAGYLRGSTRDWVSLGTATYNRANLSQSIETIPVGPNGDTINVMSTATWADLWPTLPNGRIDVRWRAEGRRLKEEIVISQAARQWINDNRGPAWAFPGVSLSDIWFGFAFRLDWADIPKVTIAGVQQSFDSDFNDDGGPIELRTVLDELLALMPVDNVFAPGAEGAENGKAVLRKRLWRDGDNHYLLVGVRCDVLAGLAAGDLVFDPTLDLQPDAAAGKDTYIHGSNPENNYGITVGFWLRSIGPGKALIEFDASSIPAGSTCDSATGYFHKLGVSTASAWTITVYSIGSGNAAWIEGSSNGAAAAGEPCWEALASDGSGGVLIAWAGSAGCGTADTDYESSSMGSFSGNRTDAEGTEYIVSLSTSRVAGWFDAGNTNYGMLLVTNANVDYLATSDYATAAYRPRLVVVYTEAGGGKPWYAYAQQ